MTFNPDNPNEHEEWEEKQKNKIETSVVKTDNGVTFNNIKSENKVDGLMVLPNKRVVMTGIPSMVIMDGSWKFGKQLQFQLTTPNDVIPVVEDRNNYSNYNRIEIDIPYEQGKEMIKALYKEMMKNEP